MLLLLLHGEGGGGFIGMCTGKHQYCIGKQGKLYFSCVLIAKEMYRVCQVIAHVHHTPTYLHTYLGLYSAHWILGFKFINFVGMLHTQSCEYNIIVLNH